jgi:TRAP-type C4-dicarboxylate transport system permease small subunit
VGPPGLLGSIMVERIADEVARGTRMLVAGCSGVMVAIVTLEVLLRYAFGRSLFFSEELSRLTFVWGGFLATSLALRKGVHASVELAVDLLPAGTRRALRLFAHAVVLFFLVLILGAGITILPGQWQQLTPTMEIRMFWFYLAVPVGVALMIVQLVPILARSFREEAR